MHQGSFDLQWAVGPLVLKGEAFARMWRETRVFVGGGVGADIMFPHVFGDAELTVALEFLYDSRSARGEAPPTFFENDAFLRLRLGFEDAASTEVAAGAIVDVLDGTTFGHFETSRRFGDHWRVSLEANAFVASSKKLEGGFGRDHFAQARLAYHF